MLFRRIHKLMLIAAAVLVLSTTAYAFAASNTVPPSYAGEGSFAISGFTVSSVHYNLNSSNPAAVDTVTFSLDTALPAGGVITIQLVSGGSWYPCAVDGTRRNVTCTTTGAPVSTANNLRVVIAQ